MFVRAIILQYDFIFSLSTLKSKNTRWNVISCSLCCVFVLLSFFFFSLFFSRSAYHIIRIEVLYGEVFWKCFNYLSRMYHLRLWISSQTGIFQEYNTFWRNIFVVSVNCRDCWFHCCFNISDVGKVCGVTRKFFSLVYNLTFGCVRFFPSPSQFEFTFAYEIIIIISWKLKACCLWKVRKYFD